MMSQVGERVLFDVSEMTHLGTVVSGLDTFGIGESA
jgi:hypothetical protein